MGWTRFASRVRSATSESKVDIDIVGDNFWRLAGLSILTAPTYAVGEEKRERGETKRL